MNFYKINPKKYLFGKSDTPEEQVRQWMLYELIEKYGYPISSIEIEYPIKVGSSIYRADIAVLYRDKPIFIVECKRQSELLTTGTKEQLYSYLILTKCKTGIVTNGDEIVILDDFFNSQSIPKYKNLISTIEKDVLNIHIIFDYLSKIMRCSSTQELRDCLSSYDSPIQGIGIYRLISCCDNLVQNSVNKNKEFHKHLFIRYLNEYINITSLSIFCNLDLIYNQDDAHKFILDIIDNGISNDSDYKSELYLRLLLACINDCISIRDKYLIYRYIYDNYLNDIINYSMFDYNEFSSRFKEICNA